MLKADKVSGMKTTKSDMAALSAEFEDNANSMQALSSKQKLLQSSVDQHKAKVIALTEQYKAAAATYGENSASAQKYRQQLNQATIALQKETSALEANSAAMREKYLAGLKAAASGAKTIFSGIGTAAGSMAKGVGAVTAASAVGVAAIGAGGVLAVTKLASMAREAAEAAKAASEAGETLTESQQQWLAYSNQLDALDASVAGAKSALAGILMPVLGELSAEGTAFLNDFSRDMTAAAGDTGKQTKVLSDYIVKGATLIKEKLPEYIATGKELFGGLAEGLSESGPELIDMGLDLCMDLLDQIIAYAPELAEGGIQLVDQLLQGLIDRGPDVTQNAVDMVTKITTGLAQASPSIIPAAAQLVTQLILTLIESAPQLGEAGLELVYGIIQGLIGGLGEIVGASEETISAIQQSFADAWDIFLDIGGDVVKAIKQGIQNAWDGVKSWFNGLVSGLTANISVKTDGSHAGGLSYVPFDGYIAELHRGEMVLTRAQSEAYRKGMRMGYSGAQKVFNLTIQTQSLSQADMDMLVEYMNEKLGEDLP